MKTGEVVSVAEKSSDEADKKPMQDPVVHIMNFSPTNSSSCGDFTIAPHGMVVTHMDALCPLFVEEPGPTTAASAPPR